MANSSLAFVYMTEFLGSIERLEKICQHIYGLSYSGPQETQLMVKRSGEVKHCCAHLSVLMRIFTYILDNAYEEYPFTSKLNALLPLSCNTFIQDLAQDLYGHQEPMFEVCLVIFIHFLNIADHLSF